MKRFKEICGGLWLLFKLIVEIGLVVSAVSYAVDKNYAAAQYTLLVLIVILLQDILSALRNNKLDVEVTLVENPRFEVK